MGPTLGTMRSSRLVALLLHLQREGRATAGQLAAVLEVSERTIYRDIAALQAAGVPLWTETGPHGGVRLVEGWRTDLDGLTGDEAASLFLSGTPGAATDLGLGTVLVAAQTKVLSTLPPELRARAARVRERFLLDAPDWFHHVPQGQHLGVVADAVWSGRRVDIAYRRGDEEVRRQLDPLGLVCKAGAWYLVAGAEGGQVRTYRVDRIVDVPPCATRRPLGPTGSTWRGRGPTRRRRSTARCCAIGCASGWDPGGSPTSATSSTSRLRPRRRRTRRRRTREGWREVDLAVESVPVAAHQLVALGGEVEALEPPELRALLVDVGRAIVERHS